MSKHTLSAYRQGYLDLWAIAKVTKVREATLAANKILTHAARYKALERATRVPWFAIGVIHMRESNCNFNAVLHNGQAIIGTGRKTTIVPIGRGPFATFEDAAIDALADYRGVTWDVPQIAFTLERFNGFGYRGKSIPSPYLWGGSSVQKRGKYVRDGVFDPNVMDVQLGAMTVLRRLCELDAETASRVDGMSRTDITPLPPPPDVVPMRSKPAPSGIWAVLIAAASSIFKRS
jgi:lysozyme family protein